KEITWRQRLLPPNGDVREIKWEAQRFDESFIIFNSDIRGITLYWQKPDSSQERSTTPSKLELDNIKQQLYIYPQSQKDVVICLALQEIIYQKWQMINPQLETNKLSENYVLVFRDEKQKTEVKIALTQEKMNQLKQQL
ncbi:MAG TPA: hypothetical protein VIQ31_10775, partial [Phormidium sp.]